MSQIIDAATAQGNLLPFSMNAGSVASVGFVMRNTGTTTWSNAGNYSFDLHRDGVWLPLADTLDHSVPPNTNHSFTFNMLAPDETGTFACFYRMKHGGFFGQENGRNVLVTSGFSGFSALGTEKAVSRELAFDPAAKWLGRLASGESRKLVLPGLEENGIAALEYTYHHFTPRGIDVVFHFRFDPVAVSPTPPQLGVSGLQQEFGLRGASDFWVRLTGTVPDGEGVIAQFPFLDLDSEDIRAEPGSFVVYDLSP